MTLTMRENGYRALDRVKFATYRVYRGRANADDNIFEYITEKEAVELFPTAVWWGMTKGPRGAWHFSLETEG